MRKEFERVSPELVGIPSGQIEALLDTLESSGGEIHSLMIMRHGKICAEGWWKPFSAGRRQHMWSATKTFTAAAIGIAYTEGLLRLEDKIADLFPEALPEAPSEWLMQLTIRNILSMGAGMEHTFLDMTGDWIRHFLSYPIVYEPGTAFYYNNQCSNLLGAILRKVSGMGLIEYMKPRLFDKIGIDASHIEWITIHDGLESSPNGLYITTEDLLRLMKLYHDGGVWDGERILAEDYVEQSITWQNFDNSEGKMTAPEKENSAGYGYQIWILGRLGAYAAKGMYGQYGVVIPEKDMVIAITQTSVHGNDKKSMTALLDFAESLGDVPLEENAAAAAHLKQRMQSLSLPAPACCPDGSVKKQIDGVWYAMDAESKGMLFGEGVIRTLQGVPRTEGIRSFRFRFEGDRACIDWTQDGETYSAFIDMDGGYASNYIPRATVPYSELLLSGHFAEPNRFVLDARWIESCVSRQFTFKFDGNHCAVDESTNFGHAKEDEYHALKM